MRVRVSTTNIHLRYHRPVDTSTTCMHTQNMCTVQLQIKARGPPADDDKTVAAQLMRLRDPKTGQPLSDDLLHAQIAIFFWAGYETSGNAMAWAVFLISQHPQVMHFTTQQRRP